MSAYPNPDDPYGQHPVSGARRPGVVLWFKVYLWVSIVFGTLLAVSGLLMVSDPATFLQAMQDSGQTGQGVPSTIDEVLAVGWVYGISGLVGVVLPVAWFLVPRGRGKWGFGVVLIALGMPGLLTLILLIPLLIFWVREDCKAWCRGDSDGGGAVEPRDDWREPWE